MQNEHIKIVPPKQQTFRNYDATLLDIILIILKMKTKDKEKM